MNNFMNKNSIIPYLYLIGNYAMEVENENICPISILFLALIEARKYRWNKGMEHCKDVGRDAIEEWFKKSFKKWYRLNWTEHLNGKKFHDGFSPEEFNIVANENDKELIAKIIGFLSETGNISENLGIMLWARSVCADMNKVTSFLNKIKINNKRFIWDKENLSLLCEALEEADKYKWIESQKAGYDLGEETILKWFKNNWERWKTENCKN